MTSLEQRQAAYKREVIERNMPWELLDGQVARLEKSIAEHERELAYEKHLLTQYTAARALIPSTWKA